MKKILTLLMAFGMAMLLVACSSGSDTEHKTSVSNMDGTYYEFGRSSIKGTLVLSQDYNFAVVVDGDSVVFNEEDKQYSINKEEKIMTGNSETLAYTYNKKTEVLTVDGKTYVKKGTKKYKEIKKQVDKENG
ncbi:hypothetical protein LGW68_10760 [Streptococcus mutans]|nr:hypothetical protein [Streptococcus mutans]MCB5122576.1 hypothetical protein [Streptococcus mutans]